MFETLHEIIYRSIAKVFIGITSPSVILLAVTRYQQPAHIEFRRSLSCLAWTFPLAILLELIKPKLGICASALVLLAASYLLRSFQTGELKLQR
jgi:hypothetical protein